MTNAERVLIGTGMMVGVSLGQLTYSWFGRLGTGIVLLTIVAFVFRALPRA